MYVYKMKVVLYFRSDSSFVLLQTRFVWWKSSRTHLLPDKCGHPLTTYETGL